MVGSSSSLGLTLPLSCLSHPAFLALKTGRYLYQHSEGRGSAKGVLSSLLAVISDDLVASILTGNGDNGLNSEDGDDSNGGSAEEDSDSDNGGDDQGSTDSGGDEGGG
jgi:hypothetical protein